MKSHVSSTWIIAGPRGAVGSVSDSRARGPRFDSQSGHIFSFLLPLIQEGHISCCRKYVHLVLVNRLGGLSMPTNSVVMLIDRPEMTIIN